MSLAAKFSVVDANGNMVCYVKQKLFKLKEDIKIYQEQALTNLLFTIKADRIIDWSANYAFYDKNGTNFGSMKRKGAKSLWRAHYLINGDQGQVFTLTEDSVFIRFLDSFLGVCSGLVFHPSYTVVREDGTPVMQVKKMTSLMEGKFKIEALGEMSEAEETQILTGIMMMLILERVRG